MSTEEIQNIYDYSKSKIEICNKLGIRLNQNGISLDNNILEYFSQIGINSRDDISKRNLSKHWLEIQKRDYELNPKHCENCGKKLPFEKRFSKCCNQSCGSALGNKKKGHRSEETKQKISVSIHKKYIENPEIFHNQYTNGVLNKKPNYKYISDLINDNIILNNDNFDYIDKEININKLQEHTCKLCGRIFYGRIIKSGKIGGGNTCSEKCHHDLVSNIGKNLRLKEIANGTFKGWKSRNIISYAEKFWQNVLENNNISYIKEYYFNNKYFLDFYIEINDRKIDLEIDGKQHQYKDRKIHDIERDKYLSKYGLEIYRIPWNEINSKIGKEQMENKINKFLNYLYSVVVQ